MKKLITLMLFFSLYFGINKGRSQEIVFISKAKSWDDILVLAKEKKKKIFVDVYTTWCGPCKKMDAEVFNQKDIAGFYNESFINVKVDAEKDWGIIFSKKNKVEGYPTYLFFNADGQKIKVAIGYMNKDDFLNLGKTVFKSSGDLSIVKSYEEIHESKNYDTTFLKKYLTLKEPINISRSSLLQEYLSRIDEKTMATKDVANLMYRYGNDISLQNPLNQKISDPYFKALLIQFKNMPFKTVNMMGAWSVLREQIINGIRTSIESNSGVPLNDYILFNEELEDNDYARKREKLYYICKAAQYRLDKEEFKKALTDFYDGCIKQINVDAINRLDSIAYIKAIPMLKQENKTVDVKKLYISEIQRTMMGFSGFVNFYQGNKKLQSQELNNSIKQWIPEVVKLYEGNPVNVNPYFVNMLGKYLNYRY